MKMCEECGGIFTHSPFCARHPDRLREAYLRRREERRLRDKRLRLRAEEIALQVSEKRGTGEGGGIYHAALEAAQIALKENAR